MASQINPDNIDFNYPVAGQPNNTQGFRDNFSGTYQNFQYAESEITELQSKGVFKSALNGTTLDNNLNDNLIYAVQLNDVSYKAATITATSGSITLDYSAATWQKIPSISGSISLAFSNWPTSGTAGLLYLTVVVTNTAYTMTLPAAVSLGTTGIQGYSAGVITFAATGTYQFAFSTVDGGASITIYDLNRPLNYFTNAVTIAATTVSTSPGTGALIVSGGVGVQGNLYVNGDIYGNVTTTDISVTTVTAVGNVVGGNVLSSGVVTVTGNVTGGNVITSGLITSTGNVQGGNLRTAGLVSSTGNVTGGNITTGGQLSATGNAIILSSTAVPAGGTTGAGLRMSSTSNLGVFFGSGAPTLSAAQGSLYINTSGSSTSTRLYVNTNGSTGWTNVTTAT